MKVGLYTLEVPATLGGGYVLRDDVARAALNLQGQHQFEMVTIPPPDPVPDMRFQVRLKRKLARLAHIPHETKYIVTPPLQRFRNDIIRRKFDLLWFNNFNPIYIDVPYVLNIFDLQHRVQPCFPEVSANGQWRHREDVWAEACRRAAIVIAGSEEVRDQLDYFYGVPSDNVHVLPFPTPQKAVDIATGKLVATATRDVRSKYGIRKDFLFYPAQFWSHKNHVNLLLALNLLRQRGREVSLVLTGSDHGNRAHVEATCRELRLNDLVLFCGFVPYEDILAFYREARALSYLSLQGPENLPPLEAMALECPVILSNIPGVKALFGEGPVIVEPRDPVSIAAGIEYVLDNPQQVRERVRASKDIAIRNDCKKYLETFQRVLDEFEPYRRCWP